MVYKAGLAAQIGARVEWFPLQLLGGSGEVSVTLSQPPRAAGRVMAHVGNDQRVCNVVTVNLVTRVVQLQVTRLANQTLGHNAPVFTGTPVPTHTHGAGTLLPSAHAGGAANGNFYNRAAAGIPLNACGAVGCDAQSLDSAGVAKASALTALPDAHTMAGATAADGAHTPAGTVAAPITHPETANPFAAGETVDLAVSYEVA